MSPSPNVSRAYAMLIHEKSQRKVCLSSTSVNDSSALMSSRDIPQKFKRYGNLYCEYCRNKVHTNKTCYKLVGYPPGFKGKKKHEYQQANAAMSNNFYAKDDVFQATKNVNHYGAKQGMYN